MDSCPSLPWTTGSGTLPAISHEAFVWRRSWTRGLFVRPAALAASRAGFHRWAKKKPECQGLSAGSGEDQVLGLLAQAYALEQHHLVRGEDKGAPGLLRLGSPEVRATLGSTLPCALYAERRPLAREGEVTRLERRYLPPPQASADQGVDEVDRVRLEVRAEEYVLLRFEEDLFVFGLAPPSAGACARRGWSRAAAGRRSLRPGGR